MPLGKIGAFAEYAAVDSKEVAKIPEYLTDEEAACIPLPLIYKMAFKFGTAAPEGLC